MQLREVKIVGVNMFVSVISSPHRTCIVHVLFFFKYTNKLLMRTRLKFPVESVGLVGPMLAARVVLATEQIVATKRLIS